MLIINFLKLDKATKKPSDIERVVLQDGECLIDYIFSAGLVDKPHIIFESDADSCSTENVVNKTDKDKFLAEDGEFTIVETPGDPITAIYAVIAIVSIAVAAYTYFNLEIPEVGNQQQGANNSLRGRQNTERPLERIEDIAGSVISYPTLIAPVYKKFNNDTLEEVEYSTMCVSVGEGDIDDVRDGETPFANIDGSSAMFYGPDRMPSVDTPFLTIGDTFNEPLKIIKRNKEVSGGTVLDWGSSEILNLASGALSFNPTTSGQLATLTITSGTSTFDRFTVGQEIDLTLFSDVTALNLDGTYEITTISVDKLSITIDAVGGGGADTVNANWLSLDVGGENNDGVATLSPSDLDQTLWAGPFFLSRKDRTEFFVNIVADGMQKDDGGSITVEYGVEYAEADRFGNQTSAWSSTITQSITNNSRDRVGKTLSVVTPFTGYCLVRVRRITGQIGGAVLQDVKLDALYSVSPLPPIDNFGNVTTVQVRTVANASATQVDERKFNCLFTRKLNLVQPDGTLGALAPTKRFIDYFVYATLSDKIGRRSEEEINIKEVYDRYVEITDHFGSEDAGEFSYTFDTDQMAFQDILTVCANAGFSRPVRRGSVITIRPELPQEAKTLFTHRNKIPEQQIITRTFESEGIKDGVEFQYVDPFDSSIRTINIPTDNSALRPEKYESTGIRNHNQAWWHAWRRYNKLKFRRINVSDTFTAEGSLLSTGDVVLISNNTKAKPQSGDVLAQQGLLLKLSEPVEFDDTSNYSIALRLRDGTTDVIPCDQGLQADEVILSRAPLEAPYTGYDEERTVFKFDKDETFDVDKYIIEEVDRSETFEIPITAYNYSDKYYERDGEPSPLSEED